MQSINDWLQILVSCKKNIKKNIQRHLKTLHEPQPNLGKGAGGDQMKPVDLAAERAIVDVLKKSVISFTLISEESGVMEFGETPEKCYVTVDPIDGTTNLVRGLPFYASSIAISSKPTLSTVFAALVTDLIHESTYTALEGEGAYRNGNKIASSTFDSLGEALIGLDVNSCKVKEIESQLMDLIKKTKHIRHFGANALELCYVADGTIDAFIDIRGRLRTTDLAAALLIIKEAGGILTTPSGEVLDVRIDPKQTIKLLASGNSKIHKTILSLVKS
jgi:myo-inositol-1(or 4)-monophosphatase